MSECEAYIIGEESGAHTTKNMHNEIFMSDGEHYKVHLENLSNKRMIAIIKIGNNVIGEFVVNKNSSCDIDRPDSHKNKFKCIKRDRIRSEVKEDVDKYFDAVSIVCQFEKLPSKRILMSNTIDTIDSGRKKGLLVETDSPNRAGTVLSKEMSNTKYKVVEDFPLQDEKFVFDYKLRINTTNIMFEENIVLD